MSERVRRYCSVRDCANLAKMAGMCNKHHRARVAGVDPNDVGKPKTCTAPGCERKHYGNGYCKAHHYSFARYGDPLMKARSGPAKYLPAAVEAAGMTQKRQLEWTKAGYLSLPMGTHGKRVWNNTEVRVCVLMLRLVDEAGFTVAEAAHLARSVVEEGRTAHRLGTGISVTVRESQADRSAAHF